MNPILHIILSSAAEKCTSDKMLHAVDMWYVKLLVLPIQKAWRRRPIRSCAYANYVCVECGDADTHLREGLCTVCTYWNKYGDP
jgi:hypothetical protein